MGAGDAFLTALSLPEGRIQLAEHVLTIVYNYNLPGNILSALLQYTTPSFVLLCLTGTSVQ